MTDELIVTAEGRRVRRMVGPTAWVVLESLTADAEPDGAGDLAVASSVRVLAAQLGLGRDAVASAVQALAVAGLVRVEASRSPAGRFGSSRYVVDPGDALRAAATITRRLDSRPSSAGQLCLLDPDARTLRR